MLSRSPLRCRSSTASDDSWSCSVMPRAAPLIAPPPGRPPAGSTRNQVDSPTLNTAALTSSDSETRRLPEGSSA